MDAEQNIADDPAFRQLLATRSRIRWGFSILVIGAYLGYGVAGLYFSAGYATPFFGSAMPWGLVMGFGIIALSVALSIIYVRVVGRLEAKNTFADRLK
ncbi:MAG: DUF485 domain-containing protein [Woeseiaceae bacterium]